MSLLKPLRGPVRKLLAKRGYVLWKVEYLRFGVLPFADVARLSRARGLKIEMVFDVGANAGQTSRELLQTFSRARIWRRIAAQQPRDERAVSAAVRVRASDPYRSVHER